MLDFEKRLSNVAEGEELVLYSAECIKNVVEEDLIKLLTQSGIPRFWTPDVDFIREERGAFQKLSAIFEEMDNKEQFRCDKFKNYIIFAMHNNNFIALNEKNEVVMVDIDNGWEKYVHSTFRNFIYSLVAFNEIVLRIIDEYPECDYYADYLKKEDIEDFRKYISSIDGKAVEDDAFWDSVIIHILEG